MISKQFIDKLKHKTQLLCSKISERLNALSLKSRKLALGGVFLLLLVVLSLQMLISYSTLSKGGEEVKEVAVAVDESKDFALAVDSLTGIIDSLNIILNNKLASVETLDSLLLVMDGLEENTELQ